MAVVVIILLLFMIILLIGIYQKNTNAVCLSKKRLDGRTVLVTGGTAGMGLEMARDLAQRGARVIVACPYPDEGARAVQALTSCSDNPRVLFKLLDLASLDSTRSFAADILRTEDRLDVLINNAGVGGPSTAVTRDGLNFINQVNYYGAFLLTMLLLPFLKKTGRPGEPSRIVNVSSASYILRRPYLENTILCTVTPMWYFISKLYIVVFSRELGKRLKNSDVVVNTADPGAVGTNIFFTIGNVPKLLLLIKLFFWVLFKHPWQGAQTALHVALDKRAGEASGEYFKNCEQTATASIACCEELAKTIWNKSVTSVKLTAKDLNNSNR